MKYEKSCGVVLYRVDGERLFLLLHYDSGHWGFPKGHVEKGEDEKETAVRETEEETGISGLRFKPNFRETIRYDYKAGGVYRQKSVAYFLAETEQEEVVLSDEHKGFEWLPFDEAMERLTYDDVKRVLRAAGEYFREHDSSLDEYF